MLCNIETSFDDGRQEKELARRIFGASSVCFTLYVDLVSVVVIVPVVSVLAVSVGPVV
jgi:hypothetical protein